MYIYLMHEYVKMSVEKEELVGDKEWGGQKKMWAQLDITEKMWPCEKENTKNWWEMK